MSDDSVGASAWQRTGRKPGLQRHLSRRAGSTGGAGGDGGGERSFTVQGASNALTSGMSRKMCIKMSGYDHLRSPLRTRWPDLPRRGPQPEHHLEC